MKKAEALDKIKRLRDQINDEADCGPDAEGWENSVCYELDRATDVIEFGYGTTESDTANKPSGLGQLGPKIGDGCS